MKVITEYVTKYVTKFGTECKTKEIAESIELKERGERALRVVMGREYCAVKNNDNLYWVCAALGSENPDALRAMVEALEPFAEGKEDPKDFVYDDPYKLRRRYLRRT